MERLTDEQRERAVTVWRVAERHIEYTLEREPWLRRWRAELTSYATVIVLRAAVKWKPNRGTKLETYALAHLRHLVSNWLASGGRRLCREWSALSDVYAGDWCCPVLAAERAELPREVERVTARLTEPERAVVLAVGRDGMRQTDAARLLGMKSQRVNRLWGRAVRKCSRELKGGA